VRRAATTSTDDDEHGRRRARTTTSTDDDEHGRRRARTTITRATHAGPRDRVIGGAVLRRPRAELLR
jgi:hypothetical protein